ncbi:unnamed protein product [Rotaria sp. Silwood2]|nr:unnamed protein product [Rotaria sp. Silwood2]CAF3092145.1 unnamed protein product [Rotaria sp. Silwood2]CAF3409305.1 unnamed protein product [Rotaria sp. Silwood2]CAF4057185.1 unnamed protein product [Rotaria sp. Silwood2]CAF4363875.1 unnamed protein product [Rotaria sp. Silwood2]
MSNIFESWKVLGFFQSEQTKNEQTIKDFETKLREKAMKVTYENAQTNRDEARHMLENEFNNLITEVISITMNLDSLWKRSLEMAFSLLNTLDKSELPTYDHISAYLTFLQNLDSSEAQPISIDASLSKICDTCIARASGLDALDSLSHQTDTRVQTHGKPCKFFDKNKLDIIIEASQINQRQRRLFSLEGAPQEQESLVLSHEQRKEIVKLPEIFKTLESFVKPILIEKQDDKLSNDIGVVQKIITAVDKITQDFNNEGKTFSYCLSKEGRDALSIYAVLSIGLYFYSRCKTDRLNTHKRVNDSKAELVEKFLPWFFITENDDMNMANKLIQKISSALDKTFELHIKELINSKLDENIHTFYRSVIIGELGDEAYDAEDSWLEKYVLEPEKLIEGRFKEKWTKFRMDLDDELSKISYKVLSRLMNIFDAMKSVKEVAEKHDGNSLYFVDTLFEPCGDQSSHRPSDKRNCMFQLFYGYLVGDQVPERITIRNYVTYSVKSHWKTMVAEFPDLDIEIKQMFRSIQNVFDAGTISYLGNFLFHLIDQNSKTEQTIISEPKSLIDTNFKEFHDRLIKQVLVCTEKCPCCKRICDADHHLDINAPIGRGSNRHCCKLGHQIRGMGGIRFESTDEASLLSCEIIKDTDIIVITKNERKIWKEFKEENLDWDFGDPRIRDTLKTPYSHIWNRIGEQLCKKYKPKITFVKENSPSKISHLIFVCDHSGSMNNEVANQKSFWNSFWTKSSQNVTANSDKSNRTGWECLLEAVHRFIEIRKNRLCMNDRITIILFGNEAKRMHNQDNLESIDLEGLNINIDICGAGTNFSAAFKMVAETLEEVNRDRERNRFQQSVIFMTDGDPQDDWTAELQNLCRYRKGLKSFSIH